MKLGDDARKCVVFFGSFDPTQGKIVYGGTGFIVVHNENGYRFHYLVTCKHVAAALDPTCVMRVNLRAGGAAERELGMTRWHPHPSPDVDISLTPFTPDADFDLVPFDLRYRLTEEKRETKSIEGGDIAYIVGLFRLHAGDRRNLPLVHTGNIALSPDANERVPMRNRAGQRIEAYAYLVEAQTLDGLSGSPVFVRRSVRAAAAQGEITGVTPKAYGAVFLLGVYLGSWDARPGDILEEDRGLASGKVRVPVGMGIVAPSDQIFEIVQMPELRAMREAHITANQAETAATLEGGFEGSVESNLRGA